MSFLTRWATDLVMLLVVAIWAFNNVVMKVALAGWVTPGAFNAVRFALGAVLLCGVALVLEGSLRLPRSLLPKVALLGLFGNGVNQMLFIYGLAQSTASNAGMWLGLLPVIVALISGALGYERVTPRLWVGACISAVGIGTVLAGQGGGFHMGWGDLLLAGAVTAWAGYTVFARPLAQQASPLRVTALAMLVAAAGLLVVHVPSLLAQDFAAVPVASWLGMFYAAALSNALGYGLYVWCVRRIGAARVALFNNLGPVLTALGAWLFLGEVWRLWQWIGAALVICGVLVARWDDIRRVMAAAPSSAAAS